MVPIKTPEGLDELGTRQRRLSQRHRTVLLLVNGQRSDVEVMALAAQAGVPPTCFDELLMLGLIAWPDDAMEARQGSPDIDPPHIDLLLDDLADPPSSPGALHPAQALPTDAGDAPTTTPDPEPGPAQSPADTEAALRLGFDRAFTEARLILLQAVRAEAPLTGSLTLLRLRRARTREHLLELLDEVEARIVKPRRSIVGNQTLLRVRYLLESRMAAGLAPAWRSLDTIANGP